MSAATSTGQRSTTSNGLQGTARSSGSSPSTVTRTSPALRSPAPTRSAGSPPPGAWKGIAMSQPSAPPDVLNNPAAVHRPEEAVSRKAVIAGAIGNFVEWYDFVLYGASAPILAKVFFSNESPQTALLATFATFAVAFVARPFGAFVLGNLGDRVGRKSVLAGIVLVMSIGTAAIALIPSYATIGLWAPLLLVIIRALQGFTAGGEFGGSAAFIVEYAPAVKPCS